VSVDSATVMASGASPDAEGAAPLEGREPAAGGEAPTAPDFRGKGQLLEEPDEKKVCKAVERLWTHQDARMKPILAQWQANEMTVAGVAGVRAIKDTDTDTYIARVPFGASAVRVGISKAAELIDKKTATLTVDPPQPDVQPSPDDQGDLAKAEFGTRILKNECTESGLNVHRLLRMAEHLAGTYGSGFILYEMDPAGGGWQPLAIDAHPAATHVDPANPASALQAPEGYADADPSSRRRWSRSTSASGPPRRRPRTATATRQRTTRWRASCRSRTPRRTRRCSGNSGPAPSS
jgi:hypothetical protein